MRAAILFIFALFILQATETTAQVLFEADFESGIPDEITADEVWAVGNTGQLSSQFFEFPAHTNFIGVNDDAAGQGVSSNGRFLTPAIDLTMVEGATISFEAYFVNGDYEGADEQGRVLISTDSGDNWTELINLGGADEWQQLLLPITNYVGDTVHIAFEYLDGGGWNFGMGIDDIKVEAIQALGVRATAITTDRYHEILEDVAITTSITNNGVNTINSLDVAWTDGIVTYTDNLTDLGLESGQSIEYTHSETFLPSAAITYNIQVTLSNPNGETDDEADNVIEGLISALSIVPVKRMVLEEGTGSWCGWCPRGFVAMEDLIAAHPETFIGIAVHNSDPMAFDEYDSNIGLSGYPSCNADRVLLDVPVSTADFEDYHSQLTARVAPASVDATATFDPNTREVTVEATATFRTLIDDLDMRMNVIILEDSIQGSGSGYNQVNYYSFQSNNIALTGAGLDWQAAPDPVPASDMYYNHVARAIIGGYLGEDVFPDNVVADQEVTQTYTYTVPNNYNPELMSAAVLLMDGNTGAVLNAGKAKFDLLSSTQPDFANERLDVFPNPAKDLVNISLNLDGATQVNLTVFNAMGQAVATAYLGNLNGNVSVPFDASRFSAGAYTFRLNLGDKVAVKQVIVE